MDDEYWVERAQAGDHEAYGELVRRHQRAAIRVAASIVGSDRAADAAQEAFLRAHRSLHRFDARRPFRPWLLRIVANAAKNEARASNRHLRLAERARARHIEIEIGADSDPAVRSDERRRLVEALVTLSPNDRLILGLRWFEEMSEAEIASVLGVRQGTVKSRLHRAMRRLRTAIGPTGVDDDSI